MRVCGGRSEGYSDISNYDCIELSRKGEKILVIGNAKIINKLERITASVFNAFEYKPRKKTIVMFVSGGVTDGRPITACAGLPKQHDLIIVFLGFCCVRGCYP